MNAPARVGLVGCGVISHAYAKNAAAFDSFEIVACADRDEERSTALAAEHGLDAVDVEALLADAQVDVVLNLTPPAAHAAVTLAALEAGKHVYSEKPLAMTAPEAAELLALADARGLRVACAPDIFLGGTLQEARTLIDRGDIGRPLAVSATMLAGGQEAWHPDPDIFFRDGAGPLLDMGPYYLSALVALLGPVARVAGSRRPSSRNRTIEIGAAPRRAVPRGDADPHDGRARARGRRHGDAARHVRGAHHYSSTFLVLGSEGRSRSPTRTCSTSRSGHGSAAVAGRTSHTARAGAARCAGSGWTTSSTRSRPGGSRGLPAAWPST